MTNYDRLVVWVSIVGSLLGAGVLSYGAIRVASWRFSPWLKLSIVASATLAFTYTAGYLWLLAHEDQVVTWSRTMRPIGMIAWFIGPWTAIPFALINQVHRVKTRMKADYEEAMTDTSSCDWCLERYGGCPILQGLQSQVEVPTDCPILRSHLEAK